VSGILGVPEPIHRLTEAEYLERERLAECKSEFFDGEVFAMSGGTPPHSQIAANAISELQQKLKAGRCVVYTSDLRLKIEATGLLTYPDFSVVCGPLQFAKGTDDTVVNPTLVGEVLSDSSEAYDRGKKFENYRQMPSLLEYLLLSQKEARIEQFSRQKDGSWLLRDVVGAQATLFLPALEVKVALSDIYAGVKFAPASIHPPTSTRT
jgi:Uma2 family endonuclease